MISSSCLFLIHIGYKELFPNSRTKTKSTIKTAEQFIKVEEIVFLFHWTLCYLYELWPYKFSLTNSHYNQWCCHKVHLLIAAKYHEK